MRSMQGLRQRQFAPAGTTTTAAKGLGFTEGIGLWV